MAAVLTRLVSTPSRLMGRSSRQEKKAAPTAAGSIVKSSTSREALMSAVDEDVPSHLAPSGGSVNGIVDGEDAEGELDEEMIDGEEHNDDVAVGSPQPEDARRLHKRLRKRRRDSTSESEALGDESASEAYASERASTNGADWEGDSDADVGVDAANNLPGYCLFCGQDEENDPGEEFEEYLACDACGDNAHRQCARENNALNTDEETHDWRCPTCIEKGVDPLSMSDVTGETTKASTARIARELLPSQRNVRQGSHSIFSNLLVTDDAMDGSRSLRKRKVSNEEAGEARKRPRAATSAADVKNSVAVRSVTPERPLDPSAGASTTDSKLRKSVRSQRVPEQRKLLRTILYNEDRFIVAIRFDQARYDAMMEERRKRRRRQREAERRAEKARAREPPQEEISHYPALQASSFATQFFLHDREGDEPKPKPYGGILAEVEADTQRTFPQAADRKRFEDARLKAEEEWKKKLAAAAAAAENARPGQRMSGPPSKIKCINFGGFEIDTWHAAPYPEEYSRNRVLYICEFCLKYMNSDFVAWRHKLKCPAKHPPGDEIYRDGTFSFFEVDGRKNPVYCQNLCLLAKLFLGSKTLYYDVEPFLFYVMTENDEFGCHFVGYFSKEKRPSSLNNVSCILVLPIHQRRGFGHYLIDFSYLLTRVEKKTGSPEKPLSDMGLVSYRSYWRLVMCYQLLDQKQPVSIATISEQTGMTADDIVSALEGLRALVRDPISKSYALRLDSPFFRQYIDSYERKKYAKVNPDALTWVPYVMGRDNMHYENAAPLHTVAQRDEGDDLETPEEGVQMELNGERSQAATEGSVDAEEAMLDADAESMPFPPLSIEPAPDDSPVAQVHHAKITASTPFTKPAGQTSPIPATRFEVFPPLPGTALRRRPGRPYGRGNRRSTPVRRNLAFGDIPQPIGRPAASLRKTRSKLSEVLPDGDDDGGMRADGDVDEDDDDEDDEQEDEGDDGDGEEEEDFKDELGSADEHGDAKGGGAPPLLRLNERLADQGAEVKGELPADGGEDEDEEDAEGELDDEAYVDADEVQARSDAEGEEEGDDDDDDDMVMGGS